LHGEYAAVTFMCCGMIRLSQPRFMECSQLFGCVVTLLFNFI